MPEGSETLLTYDDRSIDKATNPAWWLVWAMGGSEEDVDRLVRQSKQRPKIGWGGEDNY